MWRECTTFINKAMFSFAVSGKIKTSTLVHVLMFYFQEPRFISVSFLVTRWNLASYSYIENPHQIFQSVQYMMVRYGECWRWLVDASLVIDVNQILLSRLRHQCVPYSGTLFPPEPGKGVASMIRHLFPCILLHMKGIHWGISHDRTILVRVKTSLIYLIRLCVMVSHNRSRVIP